MRRHKIIRDTVQEFPFGRPDDLDGWNPVLAELCKPLDLARPVMMEKHLSELERFGMTRFSPSDFMESVDFDVFEVEIYPEKKESGQEWY